MLSLIESEYNKLENVNTAIEKYNILNNIIQIKIEEKELSSHKNSISVDVKKYINVCIVVAEDSQLKYDVIKSSKFEEFITEFDKKDQILYVDYFLRQLEKNSFTGEIKSFQKLKTKFILQNAICNLNFFKSWVHIFIHFPLYNLYTLCITLILIGIFTSIILLPAPFNFMGILNYNLVYNKISDNFYINHFFNVIGSLCGIELEFKVVPLSSFAMFTLIIGKVFMFISVTSLIINKLTELIKR